MRLGLPEETVDTETGEVTEVVHPLLPTHFKCRHTGVALEVENPNIWVYPDVEDDQ